MDAIPVMEWAALHWPVAATALIMVTFYPPSGDCKNGCKNQAFREWRKKKFDRKL